jgi:non-ribosomal peptide synthetase component F
VFLERRLELVAALLGILKAGGAYVPLDPAYPRERLAFLLADSGAALVLTQESLRGRLPESGALVLETEVLETGSLGHRPAVRRAAVEGDRLAYVIYTSGSTGLPKGVEIRHGCAACWPRPRSASIFRSMSCSRR